MIVLMRPSQLVCSSDREENSSRTSYLLEHVLYHRHVQLQSVSLAGEVLMEMVDVRFVIFLICHAINQIKWPTYGIPHHRVVRLSFQPSQPLTDLLNGHIMLACCHQLFFDSAHCKYVKLWPADFSPAEMRPALWSTCGPWSACWRRSVASFPILSLHWVRGPPLCGHQGGT